MYCKTLTTSAFLLFALVSVHLVTSSPTENINEHISNDEPHNLTLGHRESGDKVLDHSEVKLDSSVLRWVEYDYTYPKSHDNNKRVVKITYVKVVDLVPNDNGGYPTLKVGGIGKNNVTIHLQSRWNKGIDFNITVYGKHIRKHHH